MEKIYVKEILEAVGGQLLGNIDAENTFVVNVQTDSRAAAAGDLFVAIVGERLDAHRFVQGAMEAGAEGCLVSTAPEEIPEGKFCVLVPDTAKAMGDLALLPPQTRASGGGDHGKRRQDYYQGYGCLCPLVQIPHP